MNQKM